MARILMHGGEAALTKNERSCYFMAMFDDVLNPKFVHFSRVTERELDAFRRLPKAGVIAHIDAAIEAWGCPCRAAASDLAIESMEPVIGAQTLRIDLWVESIDRNACTYGFICSSENGNVAYARGERTIANADAALREHNTTLLKDLPAYA